MEQYTIKGILIDYLSKNDLDGLVKFVEECVIPIDKDIVLDCIPWYDLNKKELVTKKLNEIENKRATQHIKSAKKI